MATDGDSRVELYPWRLVPLVAVFTVPSHVTPISHLHDVIDDCLAASPMCS